MIKKEKESIFPELIDQNPPQPPTWPPIPVHGDGVSRMDPRTWETASAIQHIVNEKSKRMQQEIDEIYHSTFPDQLSARILDKKAKILRLIDDIASDITKPKTDRTVTRKSITVAKNEIAKLFDDEADHCSEWGKIYEELYQKDDQLTKQLVQKTQRFLQICPEYGYPCSPGMEGSVYCIEPFYGRDWLKNIQEIRSSREKKAGVPKNMTIAKATPIGHHGRGNKRIRNNRKRKNNFVQYLDEGTSLVTTASSKREQHSKRSHLAGMNHITDANPHYV